MCIHTFTCGKMGGKLRKGYCLNWILDGYIKNDKKKKKVGGFPVSSSRSVAALLVWVYVLFLFFSFFFYRWMDIRVCWSQNVIRK